MSGLRYIAVSAAAFVGTTLLVGQAGASPLTLTNPGFDATVLTTFSYESVTYNAGNPMPDHTYTTEDISGNGDNISAIGDSASGAVIPGAAISLVGYTGSPGSGLLRDSRDYLPGQGPTGPGGLISSGDQLMRGIFQTLTGVPFQPNTKYTFTATVADRRFGAGDNVQMHDTVQLSLAGSTEPAGTFTFVRPPSGGSSLATYTFTSGPAGTAGDPTGDITLVIRAGGFTPASGAFVAAQTVFDNLTLDATPVPEPAVGAAMGLALLAFRRRRTA